MSETSIEVGRIAVETIDKVLLSMKAGRFRDVDMFLHDYEKKRDALLTGSSIKRIRQKGESE